MGRSISWRGLGSSHLESTICDQLASVSLICVSEMTPTLVWVLGHPSCLFHLCTHTVVQFASSRQPLHPAKRSSVKVTGCGGQNHRPWAQAAWVRSPARLLTCCGTPGKQLSLGSVRTVCVVGGFLRKERVRALELCLAQRNSFLCGVRFPQHVTYLKSLCFSSSLVYGLSLPSLRCHSDPSVPEPALGTSYLLSKYFLYIVIHLCILHLHQMSPHP